jgi:GWxTD domain-containing protein
MGLSCLLMLCLGCAATGPRKNQSRPDPLEVELATAFNEDGSPAVGVTVAMPYRSLIFHKTEDQYQADLRVTVTVLQDDTVLSGGVAVDSAKAEDYAGTRSGARLRVQVPVNLENDNTVELRVLAEVVGSSRWWERRLQYSPGAARDIPWAFGGFEWNVPADVEQGLRLDATLDSVRVDVKLVQRPASVVAEARPTTLVLEVQDGHGAALELARHTLPHPPTSDQLMVQTVLDASIFPFGLQALAIRLEDDKGGILAMVPNHSLVNLGIPFVDTDTWRRHVGWLDHASTDDDDLDAMADLPFGQRSAAWREFWQGRQAGKTISETEHLLRIVEADRRFGNFGRGALSDRGRYLIRYGSPDHVDYRVMERHIAGDWEIWYYRVHGFRVIFHDAYGLGDFREYSRMPI